MELAVPFADRDALIAYYSRQMDCDPLVTLSHAIKATLIAEQQGYDAAMAVIDDGMAVGSNLLWLRYGRHNAQLLSGRADLMLAELREAPDTLPAGLREPMIGLALAALGRTDEARAVLDRLRSDDWRQTYYVIALHAVLGDRQSANALAGELDA